MERKIMNDIMCAVFAMHLGIGYVISWSFGPFYLLPIYPIILIPVVIVVGIGMYRLEKVWTNNSHELMIVIKHGMFWGFFLGGFGLITGCGFFTSQLLVSTSSTNITKFVLCTIVYLLYFWGIKRSILKKLT
jgi:hypothetical protein